MRIVIRTLPSSAGNQLRAYAEYRVFSQLASLAREIASVRVAIHQATDGSTECAITADLGQVGRTRARSRRPEPSRAIDAAVNDLAEATSERLGSR
jgi:hypothetical protein